MKIGIITFQNAHNYGAMLQAYALKTFLEKNGHVVECINYINENIEKNYLYNRVNFIKVKGFRSAKKWLKRQLEISIAKKEYKERWKKFEYFISKYLIKNKKIYFGEDCDFNQYDILIYGSDQIWNNELTGGFDPFYFGSINTKALKISYAASIGKSKFNTDDEKKFLELLKNFDVISVREEKLEEYIKNKSTFNVKTVLDPTLLLEKEDYEKLIPDVQNKSDKYILQYTIYEDENIEKIAKQIAKENKMNIKEVRYSKKIFKNSKEQLLNIGVEEFLYYIKNAEYVVTNSYHGTIFSILFNKKFYVAKNRGGNTRIENLLKITKLENRYIKETSEIKYDNTINFDQAMEMLKEYKCESKIFLNETIRQKE